MMPPLGQLGLLEYRLNLPGQPQALPDLALPLPAAAAVDQLAAWKPWLPLLRGLERCLNELGDLISDPWLEFDQPGTAMPGVFVRLQRDPGAAEREQLRRLLALQLPNLPPPPSREQLGLPQGVHLSHLGLFSGREASGRQRWRCNLSGPATRQWEWIRSQLSGSTALLEDSAAAMALLHGDPPLSDWSATIDWSGQPEPRLGIELFAPGRLQQGSSLSEPAVRSLLQAASPLAPPASLARCIVWHRQRLGQRHAASFSHLKLVADPSQPLPLELKLYLLAHASC